jgi:hypothetical protein
MILHAFDHGLMGGWIFYISYTFIRSTIITRTTLIVKGWVDEWVAEVDNVFLRLGGFVKVDNSFG